jgi:hypothetical protein
MTPPSSTSNHPPLAHADDGNRLPLPPGTTHWRILRGRDTQPARFGLEMTRQDLLELCGPGTYTIEASDQYGHRLDHVTTVTVGEPPARPSGELRLVSAWQQRAANDQLPAEPPPIPDFDEFGLPLRLPPPPVIGGELEVILDGAPQPERTEDKIAATAHVLRVRGRLAPDEQRAFDELMRGDSATRVIRMVLSRDEDDALAAVRERIARRVRLEPLQMLTPDEQAIVMSTLLLRMSPAEASLLIRTYLANDKTG